MKKTLSFVLAASICISLFAADIFKFAPLQGEVGSYTKTNFTIASKFGKYFRTPSEKFSHTFDANGKEIESTEFTAKDVPLNTVKSTYDSLGNLISNVATTPEGEIIWKSEITYKNNLKSELSEYNSKNELKGKTIFIYTDGKLTDESNYNAEGALLWKIIYTYNKDGKVASISEYSPDGKLSVKAAYEYGEDGKINTINHFDSITKDTKQEVFRYNDNGTLNEITTYTEDKQVIKRIPFKYDAKGNVREVTTYNVAQKFGTVLNELVAMEEYNYEYKEGDDSVTIIPE